MSTKVRSNIKFANNLKKPKEFLGTWAKSKIWESNYLAKSIAGPKKIFMILFSYKSVLVKSESLTIS